MSIQQGIALGLDISRGARHESRVSAEHDQAMRERKEQAEYLARMRPLQEQQAQLGLQDLEGQVAYNKEQRPLSLAEQQAAAAHAQSMRPIELESAQLGVKEQKADSAYRAQLRPLDIQQAQLGLESGRENLNQNREQHQWQRDDRATNRLRAERAERLQRVQQMAPIEYDRYARTGKFSDAFLRDSMDTPLSPFNALDAEHVDALNQAKEYFDPRNQQANPYADSKVFKVASTLLRKELNNGGNHPETGLPIVDKQIVSVRQATTPDGQPLKGQLFVELEMTDEQGNTYRAPVTTNRSSAADDALQPMDFGKFVGRVNAQHMFVNAIKQQPEGMTWLEKKHAQLNGSGAAGAKLKSDETMWAGRPQKTDAVYKRFAENPAFGNADEGVQYVSYGDFEWTEGDPKKLKFLEDVARENKAVMTQFNQLRKDDPEEANNYLKSNYVYEPDALWEMQRAAPKGGKADDPKAAGVLANIVGSNQTNEAVAAPDPVAELTSQPDWWLTAEKIPTAAAQKLTPEQWQQRYAHIQKSRQAREEQQQLAGAAAKDFVAKGGYSQLSRAEQTQWFKDNARYLSLSERKQLINGNQ